MIAEDNKAPVVDRTGSQTYYNNRANNRSDRLFGFFAGAGAQSSLAGHEFHCHTIKGKRVSWYQKARYMRKCATVNFLRLMFVGRLCAAKYSIECDEGVPEEIEDLVRENFRCWWDEIVKYASFGCMDFGWQGCEQVYRLEDGYWNVDKVKPLLHDITGILEATRSGDFLGFNQGTQTLYADDGGVLLFNFKQEGTYHYGEAPLKALECAYDRQCRLYEQIEQFDGRLASTHWAIYYPIGKTPVAWDENGQATEYKDNYDIAVGVMDHLLTTGSVIIPSSIEESIQRLNEIGGNAKGPWRIEILSAGESGQSPYQERLRYYDVSMARALGFPERSVFEGEHGTKAESETQSEESSVIFALYQQEICRGGNDYFVRDLIETNFGSRYAKKVRIVPSPIKIDEQDFMRRLYERLLNDPELLFIEHENIDMAALRERIGVPVDEDVSEQDDEELLRERRERQEGENADHEDGEDRDDDGNADPDDEKPDDDLEMSDCGAGSGSGGGFGAGNTCASGVKSKKSKVAARSAVRVDATVQRYCEGFCEEMVAGELGGQMLEDNEPADIVGETYGIELKTMVLGKNDKITMKKKARDAKSQWEKANGKKMHTVVIDDRDALGREDETRRKKMGAIVKGRSKANEKKRRYYYREGFGSFRLSSMQEVTLAELKEIFQ